LRTIAHVSDLHFGRVDAPIPAVLRTALLDARPDLLVVSGDLTQRARRKEFEAARAFLDGLPLTKIVVPGNHDVPLYDLLTRWRTPWEKYRLYISEDLEPFYCDSEIAVQGVNTARSLTFKNGRINFKQVERICARLESVPGSAVRIVVTHHPFALPSQMQSGSIVGRAEMAVAAFACCRVDMILSGHFHFRHAASWSERYPGERHVAILVHAGSATSERRRGESNSWNLVKVSASRIDIESQVWNGAQGLFEASAPQRFERGLRGWQLETGVR